MIEAALVKGYLDEGRGRLGKVGGFSFLPGPFPLFFIENSLQQLSKSIKRLVIPLIILFRNI